jgi:restriction system protein
VARRTSIFVQMQREAARRQHDQLRIATAHARLQQQTQREAVRAQREVLRLADQKARTDARTQAEEEKQRKAAHLEARQADTAEQNADLAAAIAELDLLVATLEVDDHVEFESLKRTADHPAFQPGSLGVPRQRPLPRSVPMEPTLGQFAPAPPTGLSKWFGGTAAHEKAMAGAHQQLAEAHEQRNRQVAAIHQQSAADQREYQAMEQDRLTKLAAAEAAYRRRCEKLDSEVAAHNADVDAFANAFRAGDPQSIVEYFTLVLANSDYPEAFPQRYRVAFVPESKQLVVEYELPGVDCIPTQREYRYVKSKDEITSIARPIKEIRSHYGSVVAQVTLRTLHEIFEADRDGKIETVVFNAVVNTIDPGTGREITPCLITVRTTRNVFEEVDLALVDPMACLERLNASVSKKPGELVPVRPVLEFDMVDKRFVEETDVLSGLDTRPNLLELTPTEFEALIQNLFAKMGLDTKQTRASRDGGVDCVAFDPRPIFGGKVVIQAKRYRNTVDVSAVRDLFGTMQNEGASKGILVTTSGYGQASYEFAANKPLELIDGSQLLYLLAEKADIEAKIIVPDKG